MKRKSVGTSHGMIVQPTYIIGTYNEDGTPDFAPITWVSKTCEKDFDYLNIISMYGTKQTKQNVQRTGQLSINLATTAMLELVDYFGQTSGKNGKKDAVSYTWDKALCVEAPTLDASLRMRGDKDSHYRRVRHLFLPGEKRAGGRAD